MITVRRAGLAAVTDLGRPGLARHGIPAGGAADQYSAAVANILAGNAEGGPLIEVTASNFAFTVADDALIAITGAPATITAGPPPAGPARAAAPPPAAPPSAPVGPPPAGRRAVRVLRAWEPVCVAAGELVTVTGISGGLRVYVAVNGEWEVSRMLGSCAPNAQLGAGTWLRAGSEVAVRSAYRPVDHPVYRHPVFAVGARPPRFGSPWTIDVTTGPDADEVTGALDGTYTVRPDSDAVGLRLAGPVPRRAASTELLSKGVPAGAVEVPPSEELLVLQRGRPVTAGYPVVAVATRVAQSVLGQVAPGHEVRFRHRAVGEAVAAYRDQRRVLDELSGRVRTVFASVGIPHRME